MGGLLAVELVTMVELDVLHPVQSPHKVEMPITTPKLSVGDVVQTTRLLLGHYVGNLAVLNLAQLLGRDCSFSKTSTCFLQRSGTKITTYGFKMCVSKGTHNNDLFELLLNDGRKITKQTFNRQIFLRIRKYFLILRL